jgi:TonB family protein
MNAAANRGDWVGQVVDGRFPLLECLGSSEHSTVFLTELEGPESQRAAIKLMAAARGETDERLTAWRAAKALFHPHLMTLFHFGRCEIDGTSLNFVVTEYADEVLSQIIPERPLTPAEAREMLEPVLEALRYLHAKGFVHGHLKPSNIMVVNNELKISGDDLQAAGEPMRLDTARDIYHAPQIDASPITPAADSWSLGATLVEILTQHPPVWNETAGADPVVPNSVPQPFADIARECLRVDPARRCTLEDVKALLEGKAKPRPQTPLPVSAPAQAAKRAPSAKMHIFPLVAGLVILIGIIAILEMRSHREQPAFPGPDTSQQSPAASATGTQPENSASPGAVTGSATGTVTRGEVAQRVLPEVLPASLRTIQGKVNVAIRVTVDATGAVTSAEFETAGPSKYFARFALESARSWKFKPAQMGGQAVPSVWSLHYTFRSSGVEVAPVEKTP